jgi:hypothetical protein
MTLCYSSWHGACIYSYMKNASFYVLAAIAVITSVFPFSIPSHHTDSPTSIKGRVDPIDGATEVWAISATDSTKTTVTDGGFSLEEKPGTYKVIVVARVPYKNTIRDAVEVANGNTTDLGVIKLQE